MELGISTASFFAHEMLEDAVDTIRDMGCRTLEVFMNTYSEYEPEYIAALAARVKRNGQTVYSVHPMGTQYEPQLFSIHSRQRADALILYERVLAAGRALGASVYVLHGPISARGAVKNVAPDWIGPITRDLIAMALAYGLTLAWENVSWCLFSRPEFADRILDAVKNDSLAFTLDIKQAVRSGYPPEAYLDRIKGRVANFHICDYRTVDGRLQLCMPLAGESDYPALVRALEAAGYSGPGFVEVYSDMYGGAAELADCCSRLRGRISR